MSARALLELEIPEVVQTYGGKDVILYALGVGVGAEPLSPAHLKYTYEADLRVLPSFAVVLGHPGFWVRELDTGLDWKRLVHGEQTLTLHRPLPRSGTVTGRSRVLGVSDKGPGKGAVVFSERTILVDGIKTATVGQTLFCRGDGGIGSAGAPGPSLSPVPNRPCDHTGRMATTPQAALIYRLSGDRNPLHADPEIARAAGFDRPILHGLATYGAATHTLLETLGEAPERVRRLDCRFKAPVFPGELLATRIWRDAPGIARFQVEAVDRGIEVISHGYAEFGDVAAQT